MNTKHEATIVGLSPEVEEIVQDATSIIRLAPQKYFIFDAGGDFRLSSNFKPETQRLWAELETELAIERNRRNCENLIGVINEPIENNWFSHTAYGKNIAWITTHNWEFYSDLPVANFVAYDLVRNMVLMQLVRDPSDEAWLMKEVIHAAEPRDCLSDLCGYKPDISRKIRSGNICPDCQNIISERMGGEALASILELLKQISRASHSSGRTTAPSIPTLDWQRTKVQLYYKKAYAKSHTNLEPIFEAEKELKAEQSAIELLLKDIAHQQHILNERLNELNRRKNTILNEKELFKTHQNIIEKNLHGETGFEAFNLDESSEPPHKTIGLDKQIGSRYPFPIAYCFRSMQAELSPTDKWKYLFNLYALIIRYLVFVLVSDLRKQSNQCPYQIKFLIRKLIYGQYGDWGKACLALLKHGVNNKEKSFFNGFLSSVTNEQINRLKTSSMWIVMERNETEHGFHDKQKSIENYERYLPDVKNMLQFIAPLADFVLIRPFQVDDFVDGKCVYHSKVMVGSDPQFLPVKMVADSMPETVCQLIDSSGATLTMHPWLHLDRCHNCHRDMVFVYDILDEHDGMQTVKLREFPANHVQSHPSLVECVKQKLTF